MIGRRDETGEGIITLRFEEARVGNEDLFVTHGSAERTAACEVYTAAIHDGPRIVYHRDSSEDHIKGFRDHLEDTSTPLVPQRKPSV